ncbi:replicase [chicory mosaic cavemovirus]|nr:replicase [chicory mosaic cavemovirus]
MNNMTYMTVKITIPTYLSRIYHGLFDTGANVCVCKENVLPQELWKETRSTVLNGFGAEKTLAHKKAENIKILIAKEIFIIPYIYAYNLEKVDIIIGATFYNKYNPILIDINAGLIKFTKKEKLYPNYLIKYPKEKILIPWEKGNPKITQSLQNKENIINKINSINEDINLLQILGEEIFNENPLQGWEKHKTYAKIELKNPNDEIYKPPMIYKEEDYKEFELHITELIKGDYIEQKDKYENKKYSSPAFIVNNHSEQKRGKTRMVIDYKDLNKKAKIIKHPIPNKDILLHRGIKAKIFSKFDCKSGFYHIKLEEESKKYTAFTVPQGYYQWKVLPFGYHNAPSIFQKFMDIIFRRYYEFIIVYIDDILIFSNNINEHKYHLKIFKEIVKENGISLSKKKAELGKEKIEFLGMQIEQGGLKIQQHIIDKILTKHIKIKNKKELQSVLGLLNQIRNFIPRLAEILQPLQKKLKIKKEEYWEWTKEDEKRIELIINYCKDNIIPLKFPTKSEEYNWIIETDASNESYGNCLKYLCPKTKQEYICRYGSGTFKEHEKKYEINRKELIAIHKGLEQYSIFTCNGKIKVRTDNSQTYYWIKQSKDKKSIETRNIIYILSKIAYYNFELELIEGKTNIIADYLSRYGVHNDEDDGKT